MADTDRQGSIYLDLIVSNEPRASISIRSLSPQTYGYQITRGRTAPTRGTVTSMGKDPLQILRLVLNDYTTQMLKVRRV